METVGHAMRLVLDDLSNVEKYKAEVQHVLSNPLLYPAWIGILHSNGITLESLNSGEDQKLVRAQELIEIVAQARYIMATTDLKEVEGIVAVDKAEQRKHAAEREARELGFDLQLFNKMTIQRYLEICREDEGR